VPAGRPEKTLRRRRAVPDRTGGRGRLVRSGRLPRSPAGRGRPRAGASAQKSANA